MNSGKRIGHGMWHEIGTTIRQAMASWAHTARLVVLVVVVVVSVDLNPIHWAEHSWRSNLRIEDVQR
ncbi:hypothetical protein V7968_04950 [Nocardia vulneris]|uniref:hypothetical protein n=1 Tax=Nocardia vulneris TaxID=1141657 RepID=UPI0030CB44E1